jgi:nucleotide-binding universal stress UspA family protein
MKILCPVDFSKAANNAVEYAARFAKATGSEIQLAHVSVAPSLGEIILSGFDEKDTFQESSEKLEDYCKEVEESFQVTCSAIIQNEDESLEGDLANYIDSNHFDLAIMGTNSAEYANQIYFGTHTYNLIRKSNTPVLIVPEECSFVPLRYVVFATDFKIFSESSITEMLGLIAPFEPGLDILNVGESLDNPQSDQELEAIQTLVRNNWKIGDMSFHSVTDEGAAEGIDGYMKKRKRDLLTLTTRKYSIIESLFRESVTKKLSFIAEYPILVLSRE